MTLFKRGLQLYSILLVLLSMIIAIWGTNKFYLGQTTAATGWPLIIGTAVGIVLIGAGVRHLTATPEQDPVSEDYPW